MFEKGHKISKVNQGNAEINGPDTCPNQLLFFLKEFQGLPESLVLSFGGSFES